MRYSISFSQRHNYSLWHRRRLDLYISCQIRSKNSLKYLFFNIVHSKLAKIFSDLKNMKTLPGTGMSDPSESIIFISSSIADDDVGNDSLDLIVIPQYGRNPDYYG
ncbi:hypothetical protein AB3S75_016044 [Citrus x aurantiifolia]